MAVQIPLIIDGGEIKQLPSGDQIAASSIGGLVLETETTAAYVVVNADLDGTKIKEIVDVTAATVTINTGLTNTQPCQFFSGGAGLVTFVAGAGVTINSAGSHVVLRTTYSSATLIPQGSETYLLIGDLVE